MPHVQSGAVARIEYDPPSRTLFVRFTSGEWYSYFDVPPRLAADFEAAESKGRFFQDHIRGHYAYQGPLSVSAWGERYRSITEPRSAIHRPQASAR